MATAENSGDVQRSHMDISQNRDTYSGFVRFSVWGTGIVVVVLILMALFLL